MSTAQTLADAVSALNNVATSHEQLNATMTAQQDVVEANFKALQDFATHPDTATFKDKNGTSFPVKSLRKLAADAEAVNPNPHVMTKTEFDALREMRKQQYAGSGFVEWGEGDTSDVAINFGMWTYQSHLNLGRSGKASGWFGHNQSTSPYPGLVVDGVSLDFQSVDYPYGIVSIKFPVAPDGTKTYDSSTGVVTKHVSAEVAFASETATNKVILSRKDLVFLEVWNEKISEKDVIYPLGNVQFGASSWSGITLSNTLVAQGYSAFGAWDETTKGHGARWSSLSEANRTKILSDPRNNLYFDADLGDYVQVRYRVRVVESCGDVFSNVRNSALAFEYDTLNRVKPKGKLISITSDLAKRDVNETGLYGTHSQFKNIGHYTAIAKDNINLDTQIGEGGRCFAVPIALVQRLNQGAMHPVFNPFGCGRFLNGDGSWDGSWDALHAKAYGGWLPQTTHDCFLKVGVGRNVYGSIAAGANKSGRSGSYVFHDAIYAGQVEDLRLSARKQNVQNLLAESMHRAISGALRGKRKILFTQFTTLGVFYYHGKNPHNVFFRTGPAGSGELVDFGSHGFGLKESIMLWQPDTGYVGYGAVYNSTNVGHLCLGQSRSDLYQSAANAYVGKLNTTSPCYIAKVRELSPEFDIIPHMDAIGSYESLFAAFPNGFAGQWIPATSSIEAPTGITYYETNGIKFGGVTNSASFCVKSTDSGLTWSRIPFAFNNDNVSNGSAYYLRESNHTIALPQGLESEAIVLVMYDSYSPSSVKGALEKTITIGEGWMSAHGNPVEGNRISYSLTNKTGKATNDPAQVRLGPIFGHKLTSAKILNASVYNTPKYKRLDMPSQGNQSGMVKTIFSLVEKNGLYYLQFNGAELKHNGTDWGDDQTIPIINGEDVKTDLNGNTVKVFCHHTVYPLGIAHND